MAEEAAAHSGRRIGARLNVELEGVADGEGAAGADQRVADGARRGDRRIWKLSWTDLVDDCSASGDDHLDLVESGSGRRLREAPGSDNLGRVGELPIHRSVEQPDLADRR